MDENLSREIIMKIFIKFRKQIEKFHQCSDRSVKIRWLNADTVEVYRISGGYQTGEIFKLEIYGFDSAGDLLYKREKEYDWRKGEFPEEVLDLKLNAPDP